MIKPPYLKNGDKIAIVSTARSVSKLDLKPALALIKKWGFQAILGKSIGAQENQFAGSDNLRATDFQEMLDNPEIKAIWCAKGGYGTVRIIDKLDFSKFIKNPKWIIGYSDVTVLHSHIHNFKVASIHAQMPVEIDKKTNKTTDSIRKLLLGEEYSISINNTTKNKVFNRLGKAKGELVGGNLSILFSLCGSNSAIKTDGKILFIEDLDEYLYHIDRMIINLKRNGMFKNLAGLIVGGMTKMNDNTMPFGKTALQIISEGVNEFDFPVCFDFPAGHLEDNRALIMGNEVEFEVQSSITNLRFLNS